MGGFFGYWFSVGYVLVKSYWLNWVIRMLVRLDLVLECMVLRFCVKVGLVLRMLCVLM